MKHLKGLLKHIILAFVALAILIFLFLKGLDFFTNHGEFILVPDLSEKTLSDVDAILKGKNLRYEVIDSTEFNPKFDRFAVISQSPEANEKVKENRKIYLTINPSGYRKITIPNVVQITRRSAEATLKAVGLEVGTITYVDDIGKDMVLELFHNGEKVMPGGQLIKTSKIDLVCGNGFEIGKDSLSVQNQVVIPVEDLH